eukprot:scaffold14878_cov41-Prasinocladus_malaysianus.AAC.1
MPPLWHLDRCHLFVFAGVPCAGVLPHTGFGLHFRLQLCTRASTTSTWLTGAKEIGSLARKLLMGELSQTGNVSVRLLGLRMSGLESTTERRPPPPGIELDKDDFAQKPHTDTLLELCKLSNALLSPNQLSLCRATSPYPPPCLMDCFRPGYTLSIRLSPSKDQQGWPGATRYCRCCGAADRSIDHCPNLLKPFRLPTTKHTLTRAP